MAVSDTTLPYEILIRFDEAGQLKGAHKIVRRLVALDGEILKDEVGQAQPIRTDDAEASDGLWGVLGQALTSALASLALRDQRIAELEAAAGLAEG